MARTLFAELDFEAIGEKREKVCNSFSSKFNRVKRIANTAPHLKKIFNYLAAECIQSESNFVLNDHPDDA
jgi:hypothetical protein